MSSKRRKNPLPLLIKKPESLERKVRDEGQRCRKICHSEKIMQGRPNATMNIKANIKKDRKSWTNCTGVNEEMSRMQNKLKI